MSAFETSLEKLKTRMEGIEVTPQTLIIILKYAIEIVELSELKGTEQRDMSIRLIRAIITDSPVDEKKKAICIELIDSGALAQTIDLVIDATKGRIQVNQRLIIETASKCAPLLCGCCETN